jgi:hypothetical protein
MVAIGVVVQKRGETVLRDAIEGLVLPQGVVGIEADGGDPLTHCRRPSFLNRPQAYILRPKEQTTQPKTDRSCAPISGR